jgi:hypothetical protein
MALRGRRLSGAFCRGRCALGQCRRARFRRSADRRWRGAGASGRRDCWPGVGGVVGDDGRGRSARGRGHGRRRSETRADGDGADQRGQEGEGNKEGGSDLGHESVPVGSLDAADWFTARAPASGPEHVEPEGNTLDRQDLNSSRGRRRGDQARSGVAIILSVTPASVNWLGGRFPPVTAAFGTRVDSADSWPYPRPQPRRLREDRRQPCVLAFTPQRSVSRPFRAWR